MPAAVLILLFLLISTASSPDIDLEIQGSADVHELVWDAVSIDVKTVECEEDPLTIKTGDGEGASTSTGPNIPECVIINMGIGLPFLYHRIVEPHQLKELTQYSLGNLWILLGIAHDNEGVQEYIRKLRSRYGCQLDYIFPFYALKLFNSPLYLQGHFTAAMLFYGEPFVRTLNLTAGSGAFGPELAAARQHYRFESTDYERVFREYGCGQVIFRAGNGDELAKALSIADLTFFTSTRIRIMMPLDEVEGALIESAKSDNLNVKRNAVLLLSKFDAKKAGDSLVDLLSEEKDQTTRFRIIYSLAELNDERLPGLVHGMIEDADSVFIRTFLITALDRCGTDESVRLMCEIIQRSDDYDLLVACMRSCHSLVERGFEAHKVAFLKSLEGIPKKKIRDPKTAYKAVRSQKMLEIRDIHRGSHRKYELDIAARLIKALLAGNRGEARRILDYLRASDEASIYNFDWLIKKGRWLLAGADAEAKPEEVYYKSLYGTTFVEITQEMVDSSVFLFQQDLGRVTVKSVESAPKKIPSLYFWKEGDVIMSVKYENVRSIEDLKGILDDVIANEQHKPFVRVRRNGEESMIMLWLPGPSD